MAGVKYDLKSLPAEKFSRRTIQVKADICKVYLQQSLLNRQSNPGVPPELKADQGLVLQNTTGYYPVDSIDKSC